MRKAPQGGEKEAKLFGSGKTELSATMTNQLCALAGSNSVWRPRVLESQ